MELRVSTKAIARSDNQRWRRVRSSREAAMNLQHRRSGLSVLAFATFALALSCTGSSSTPSGTGVAGTTGTAGTTGVGGTTGAAGTTGVGGTTGAAGRGGTTGTAGTT